MSQREIDTFFEIATQHEDLMRDIFISVPVRQAEGMALELTNMLSAWSTLGIMWSALDSGMNGFVDVTRMKIAYDFLHNRTQKYLMMIDSDTEPRVDLPYILARHDKDVVGGCIPSMNAKGRRMLCFTRYDKGGIPRFIDFEDGDKIPATGLAEVPHSGTGVMMIRRDVLEAFTYRQMDTCGTCGHADWDIPFMVPDGVKARGMKYGVMIEGEDIRFCKQVRQKGFKIWVDLEGHCGHRKSMRLGFPQHLRDPSMKVESWCAPDTGMALLRDGRGESDSG